MDWCWPQPSRLPRSPASSLRSIPRCGFPASIPIAPSNPEAHAGTRALRRPDCAPLFVITQVALTLVLLVVAGLLMRSVTRYRDADLGFESCAHSYRQGSNSPATRYEGRDMLTAFYAPLEERVRHLPGVESAGLINVLPIDSSGDNSYMHIAGQPPLPQNSEMLAESRYVSRLFRNHGRRAPSRPLALGLSRPARQ